MEQEKGHVRESQLKEQFCIMSLGKYVLIWVAGGYLYCVSAVNHLKLSTLFLHL